MTWATRTASSENRTLNPAAEELFPGGLAASLAGGAWTCVLALLMGATVLPLASREGASDDLSPAARLTAWMVAGFGLLPLGWLGLSALGQLRPWPVLGLAVALTAAGLLLAGRRIVATVRALSGPARLPGNWWPRIVRDLAILAIALLVMACLLLATLPSVFYDDLVYHLGLPRQALLTGAWPALAHFHYSFMPAGWDSTFVLPLSLGGGTGPQFLNAILVGLLAATTWRLARLGGSEAAAGMSAALLMVAPMFLSLGAFAANDLFAGLALASALEHLLATRGGRPVATGLLAGAAWGAKYTTLAPIVAMGVALLLLHAGPASRRLRAFAGFGATAALVPCAWHVRAFLLTGNPLYPAFRGLLGGRGWDEMSATRVGIEAAHGSFAARGWQAFPLSLWDLVAHSDRLGHPSGLAVAFLPIALIGLLAMRRVKHSWPLLVVASITWLAWCLTSLNLRYAIIMLVALAPFAAAALERVLDVLLDPSPRQVVGRVLFVGGLTIALGAALTQSIEHHEEFIHLNDPGLASDAVRSEFLVRRLPLAGAGSDMARKLPADARLLCVGDARLALLPRPATISSFYDSPSILDFVRGAGSVEGVDERIRAAGITHVVVNFAELRRRASDYGYLTRFTPDEAALFERWLREGLDPLATWGEVVLYEPHAPAQGVPAP